MKSINDLPPSHPMRDTSPEGKALISICTIGFEKYYDPTRKFADLNPDVQETWLRYARAILLAREYKPV
jgi:hypothetical protein